MLTNQELKDRLLAQLLILRSRLDDAYNMDPKDDKLIAMMKQIQTEIYKSLSELEGKTE